VVRGLVQEDQLRLPRQGARYHQAFPPAARERGGGLRAIREAGAADGHGDAPVGVVLVVAGLEHGLAQHRLHRGVGSEARVLGDVAEPKALADRAASTRRLVEAGEDAEQRRLAGAVRAHEPRVIALEDSEGESLEEGRAPEGLGEVLARQQELRHAGAAALPSRVGEGS
jgi:hypothetical protein